MSLRERAERYVAACPPAIAGQHGHVQFFKVLLRLATRFPELPLDDLAEQYNARCLPPFSDRDLAHKLNEVRKLVTQPGHAPIRAKYQPSPKAKYEPGLIARVVPADRRDFLDWKVYLADRSPIDPAGITPTRFLTALYQTGETVVVVPGTQEHPGVRIDLDGSLECPRLDALATGENGVWYLCQPTDGQKRPKQPNGTTCRSEINVTDWRHLVLESDQVPPTAWLPWLVTLPARLRAIYTSGGASIHALVRIDAESKADWDATVKEWKPTLTRLGACPGCLSAVRLTRLPGCRREETGRMQELLWLNPDADEQPINTLPQLRHLHEPF